MSRSKFAHLATMSNGVDTPKAPKEPTRLTSHPDNSPRTPTKEEQLARRTHRLRAFTANQSSFLTAQIEDISGPVVTMTPEDQEDTDEDDETTWLREQLEQAYRVTARGQLPGKRKRSNDGDREEVAMLFFSTAISPNTIWANQDEQSRCDAMPGLAGSSQETVESTNRDPTTPKDNYSKWSVRAPSFSPLTPTAPKDEASPIKTTPSFSTLFPHSRLRRSPPTSPTPVPRKVSTPGTIFNPTTLLERYNQVSPADLGPHPHAPARRVAWLTRHSERAASQWIRDRGTSKTWASKKGLDTNRHAFKIGKIEAGRREPQTEGEQEGWLGGQTFTEGVRRVLFLEEMERNALDEGMGWVSAVKKRKMMIEKK